MTRQELFEYVKDRYCTEPEYLWDSSPEAAVLRNKDNKWYGIVMNVSKRKFGIDSDEYVDVLNVKTDPMLIDTLINLPGYYRAYHMNKYQWISMFLDGTVPDEAIKELVADSMDKTSKKKVVKKK